MITLTDMGVMYTRTCATFRISRLRNRVSGRSAARVHKGEAPHDEYGRKGGAYKVAVYGSVPRGQQRTADQDQGVTTEPIGGPLRVYLRALRSYGGQFERANPIVVDNGPHHHDA